MDLSAPYSVVTSKSEGAILKVLAGTLAPLGGREVARLAGSPKTTVARALKRLAEHGLVEAREVGSGVVTLYTLNRDHLAAGPVLGLLNLRQAFLQRLTQELEGWQARPYHASLFGSAARGDGNINSDIDIFMVRPAEVDAEAPGWRGQLLELQGRVMRWTGNHAGVAEVSVQDLERLTLERPAVVTELERDAITLVGPAVNDMFRATQ